MPNVTATPSAATSTPVPGAINNPNASSLPTGWTMDQSGHPVPPAAAPAATTPYTIKSGDTLHGIAGANKTDIATLMKLNPSITNPNLIIAGKSLNLPGQAGGGGPGSGTDVPDYSQADTHAKANAMINADQGKDYSKASGTNTDEPPTRKTLDDYINDVKTATTPTTPAPTPYSSADDLTALRGKYGVADIESTLNGLKAQARDLQATSKARTDAEMGKSVPMNVIEGRVSEEERQDNERLTAINDSIKTASDMLTTANTTIDMMMKADASDYATASTNYEKQMSDNLAIFSAARGEQTADQTAATTAADKAADNARSNAQIAINALTAAGTTYDTLTPDQQANLTKLGVASGLGADFFSTVLKTSAGKPILTTIVSTDKTQATVVYKDGTTKTISTGLSSSGSGSTAGSFSDQKTQLEASKGSDGYVNTDTYKEIRSKLKSTQQTAFDKNFSYLLNPNDASASSFIKASTVKNSPEDLKATIDAELKKNNAFGKDHKINWQAYLWAQQNWQENGGNAADFKTHYPIGSYLDAGNVTAYNNAIKGS